MAMMVVRGLRRVLRTHRRTRRKKRSYLLLPQLMRRKRELGNLQLVKIII
jgi:hypothetical protein